MLLQVETHVLFVDAYLTMNDPCMKKAPASLMPAPFFSGDSAIDLWGEGDRLRHAGASQAVQ